MQSLKQTGLTTILQLKFFINICGTACVVCRSGTMKMYGVRLSVPAWAHSSKPAAAGLLPWALRAGDINRLLQQWQMWAVPHFVR